MGSEVLFGAGIKTICHAFTGENMLVKEIMLKEVLIIRPETTLAKLIKVFKGFHSFPLISVADEQKRLLGVIRLPELLGTFSSKRLESLKNIAFLEGELPKEESIFEVQLDPNLGGTLTVQDLMDKKIITVEEETPVEKAFMLMKLNSLEKLPVIDKEMRLKGIIGVFDIILALFHEKGVIP